MIEIMSDNLVDVLKPYVREQLELPSGGYLFHLGDRVSRLFIVDEGVVELTRYQEDGSQLVLQRAGSGEVLAEASVYSRRYHCDAVAIEPTRALAIPKPAFKSALETASVARLWTMHLARETQRARFRAELLGRRTVASRLDGWLDWEGNDLPPKGQWKDLARELAVSPEALYREISRRKRKRTGTP